jgi:hypothetical protein
MRPADTNVQSVERAHFTTGRKRLSKFRLLILPGAHPIFSQDAIRRSAGVNLEEQLKHIDSEIRKLKIAFDLYFIGANPKPPNELREAVDKMLKKHQGTPMRNAAERFLYSSLVNKFNAYQELWSKGIKNKEEGARVHPLAARAAQRMAATETGGTTRPGPGAAAARRAARPAAAEGEIASGRLPTSRRDEEALRKLYNGFVAAKSRTGNAKTPSFDAFAREIAKQTAALRGKIDCDAIDFKIYCKDNKVSIKARPAK